MIMNNQLQASGKKSPR